MTDAPLIVLKELAGNPPPQLNAIQVFFAPYAETLVTFWWSVWILTTIVMLNTCVQAYRKHRAR